jgi:hypothetical protein
MLFLAPATTSSHCGASPAKTPQPAAPSSRSQTRDHDDDHIIEFDIEVADFG